MGLHTDTETYTGTVPVFIYTGLPVQYPYSSSQACRWGSFNRHTKVTKVELQRYSTSRPLPACPPTYLPVCLPVCLLSLSRPPPPLAPPLFLSRIACVVNYDEKNREYYYGGHNDTHPVSNDSWVTTNQLLMMS